MKVIKLLWKVIWTLLIVTMISLIVVGAYQGYQTHKRIKAVEVWEPMVREVTEEYQLEEYKDVVLAIILTESKGDHLDVMQSSESRYGQMNAVATSRESIEIGVNHLSEVLKEAQEQGTDVWTGVQAYNFGSNYITYVSKHGGKHSVELAETYSRDVLAPMLGNETGNRYHYWQPRAILYNGGYLYQNGGNFFYAQTVDWNLRVMALFKALPFN